MMINQAAATCCLLLSALASSSQAVNIRGATAIDEAFIKNNDHSELRQLNLFCSCISAIDSSCHPNSECESFDKCTNPKGKDKCNASGNYIWRPLSTPPPTTASTPPPTTASTPPPAPSSSCGKCVADNYSTPCLAPTDCPTVLSPGTCSAPTPQPTNGSECTQDSQCEPISGKPNNRGTCNGGGTTNTVCDTTLTCPPSSPPVTETLPPTSPPTSNPTDAATPPPTVTTPSPTPFPTGPQTCPEQYCPASSPSRKLEATLPRRRDVVQCDLTMITLATYTAPGTSDVLIELKGPASSADALDLVIAAPHGGGLKPTYIDSRSGSGIVTSKDSYTLEVSELLAQSLIDTYCVGVPYLIINHLHRSKLDANRELEEATIGIVNGKATAEEAWNKFHTYINDAQVFVRGKFGTSTGSGVTGVNGLFFDMHGYIGNNGKSDASATTGWKDDVNIHGAPFTQWGYRLSDDPSLTSCPIDNLGGTIGSFTHARSLPNQSYECLVRGPNSMGSRVNALLSNVAGISDLCGQGTPSFEYTSPNALATDATYCNDAAAGGECHYYSGGFDVKIHERMDVDLSVLPQPTLSGEHFNALQAELPRCIRFGGDTIRSDFAGVLAQATMGFLRDLNGPMP